MGMCLSGDPCIVHKHVDPSEGCDRLFHPPGGSLWVGHVCLATARAWAPTARSSAAICSFCSCRRAATTTVAPSAGEELGRRQADPEFAPVMIATRSSNCPFLFLPQRRGPAWALRN